MKGKSLDDDECIFVKDIGYFCDMIRDGTLENKIYFIKHLRKNPLYKCYFCNGYNYNCEGYEVLEK